VSSARHISPFPPTHPHILDATNFYWILDTVDGEEIHYLSFLCSETFDLDTPSKFIPSNTSRSSTQTRKYGYDASFISIASPYMAPS
jgi:hypothetical protein